MGEIVEEVTDFNITRIEDTMSSLLDPSSMSAREIDATIPCSKSLTAVAFGCFRRVSYQ